MSTGHTHEGSRAPEAVREVEGRVREAEPPSPAGNVALGALMSPRADSTPWPGPQMRHIGLGGARGALTPTIIRALQRAAGNGSTQAIVERLTPSRGSQRASAIASVQRAGDVAVTGLTLSASKVTIPLSQALRATARPTNATGVTFSVQKGTVDPSGVAIDAATGVITVAAGQQGGSITVKATASDGSWVTAPVRIIEKPTAIASTSASGADDYGGQFVHTFSAPSGQSSGLEGGNINEKFKSLTATPPWGGKFKLTANPAGSHGWDLDSSGAMAGPDNVTISAGDVDVGRFVKSASNPTPKSALPQGFTMDQKLHAKSFPSGKLDGAAFTTVAHKRTLVSGPKFEVSAGSGTISEDYSGPAAVTNATASASSVMASPPKPKSGPWDRKKVTVRADVIPSTGTTTFSIKGKTLGCSVDSSGEVSIGSTAGTITVRVSATKKNFDEVKITITAYKPPPPTPTSAPGEGEGLVGGGGAQLSPIRSQGDESSA